jgi:N-acetylmuramoyl-L-alanine amidase
MLLGMRFAVRIPCLSGIAAERGRFLVVTVSLLGSAALSFAAWAHSQHTGSASLSGSAAAANRSQAASSPNASTLLATQSGGLNIVVLDPAHGGTDYGARGTEGVRESEVVLEFAVQVRRALETQGFQVVQTRLGNEDPTFDERSARANAQQGAMFVTLHVASTGLPGTARVYVNEDLPVTPDVTGLIPWERAQGPFLSLSRRLGDLVQGQLAQRFKGSPNEVRSAAVRQLRTTAAPAIAVEISSVTVENRNDLDRMAPGVADAIAKGATAFRPSYVVAGAAGVRP